MDNQHINRLAFVLEDNLAEYRELILNSGAGSVGVPRNTVLSRGGTPTPYIYFVLDGMTKASVVNINGYERVLGYHKRNTFCAMDGLHEDSGVFVTITTVIDSCVVPMNVAQLSGLMSVSKSFAAALLLYYSDVIKLMSIDAESQSSNSVLNKLANFILLYMQSEDYLRYGYLPFSQQELASAIGASRVQVARVCGQLKKAGIVDINKRKLYILRPGEMEDMASLEVRS